MNLYESTWKQVEDYLNKEDRVILPLGSTEQHGLRGVFGVDYLIPEAVALEVGKRSGILVLPVLPYGMSLHHMGFRGTMSLRPSTYQQILIDLLTCCARHDISKVLILNGHGGNNASIQAAVSEVGDMCSRLQIKEITYWEYPRFKKLVTEEFADKEGMHATPSELSIIMHLRPGLLTSEKIDVKSIPSPNLHHNLHQFKHFFPTGSVLADSNLATAEIGKILFDILVEEVLKDLDDWITY